MNFRYSLLLPSLFALAASSHGQAKETRLAQLAMDPPSEILGSMPAGHLDSSKVLHLSVNLPLADAAGLQRFVDDVSNPRSASYRHFISPAEVGRRFGLSTAKVQQVVDYLVSKGIKVKLVTPNRIGILVDATVAQAEAAFHTSIEQFVDLSAKVANNRAIYSYTTSPSVPATITPYIKYVGGLETFTHPIPRSNNNPVSPIQLRTFYNVAPIYTSGFTGAGRTIGISNWDAYYFANVGPWITKWGLPTPAAGAGSNISVRNPSGDHSGGTVQGELDLDVQSVLGTAPLANIVIYDAGSGSSDMMGVLNLEASDNKCDIITESWGWYSSSLAFYDTAHTVHLSMSAQGITYLAASGDSGTADLTPTNRSSNAHYAPYPDMDPEVLVVGGTTTTTVTSGGNLLAQTGWAGSGGGWAVTTNAFNALPAYQKGKGIPSNIPYRLVPDVALNADPNTPYWISLQAGEFGVGSAGIYAGIGGTSAATPTFAGSLADSEQQIIANNGLKANSLGYRRFGRINDLVYAFNGDPSIFTDITSGSNGTLPNGTISNAGTGWDFVTGWGVMNFYNFAKSQFNTTTISGLSVSPVSFEGGSSTVVTGTVTLSAAASAGGASVTLTSSNSAASVPTSVTVLAGSTQATFTVTTSAVPVSTSTTITGSYGGGSSAYVVTVTPPSPTGVALSLPSVIGGTTSTGTVTIAEAAPAAGLTVALASDNSAATVPTSVTVASGQKTATFTVTTIAVPTAATANITATSNGKSVSTPITVNPATYQSLTLSTTTVVGGNPVTGTISLSGPAATAQVFALTLSNSTLGKLSATSVTIPIGSSSATFTVTPAVVSAFKTLSITATSGVAKSVILTINPAAISSVVISKTPALGGVDMLTATVTLTGPAGSGGQSINVATTPATAVTIAATTAKVAAGATTVIVPITTIGVSVDTNAYFSASFNGGKTANFVVRAALLNAFTLTKSSVQGGSGVAVTGTVTLEGPNGASSRGVAVTSSNPSIITVVPTVAITGGKTMALFSFKANTVTVNTPVTITAKLGTVTKTVTITVTP